MKLVASDVGSERGGRRVFRGVSFSLGDGEILAVTGPNGAGKSTLLRIIAGLLPATEGSVTVDTPTDAPPQTLMHYLGHRDGLKNALTVRENLTFWRSIGHGDGIGILDALDRVRLPHVVDMPAAFLSAGQRRRVAIARLLVVTRPVWLLDEPTSALDAASEKDLGGLLTEHLAANGIVIAATHLVLPVAAAKALRLGMSA